MELELKGLMDLVSRPISPIFDPEYLLRPCVELNKNVKQAPPHGFSDALHPKVPISNPIDPGNRTAVSWHGNAGITSTNTVGSTISRLEPSPAVSGLRRGESIEFAIGLESRDMGRKRGRQELENNDLRKAKMAKCDSQYYRGYTLQEQLTGERNLHLLTTKDRIPGTLETKSIEIDGVSREIQTYGEHAVILMNWNDPRTVTYGDGKCNIIFDEGKYVLPMKIGEDYRKFNIAGETHRVKLGVPTQELMLDGVGYQCAFGGKPVTVHMGGRLRTIRLDGKTPKVNISNTKNTDFLAGKIQLEINSTVIDVFLDSKPQRFYIDGKEFIIRGIMPESPRDLPAHFGDSSKHPTHSSMRPCNMSKGISVPCTKPYSIKPAFQGFPSHSCCPIVPQAPLTMAPMKGTSATCNTSQPPLWSGLPTLPVTQANMSQFQNTTRASCVTNQLATNMAKISRPPPHVSLGYAFVKEQEKKCENKEKERLWSVSTDKSHSRKDFQPQVQELLTEKLMQQTLPNGSYAELHHVEEVLKMTLPKEYYDGQEYLPKRVSVQRPSLTLSAPKDLPPENSPHAEFTVSQGQCTKGTSSERPPHTDDKIKAKSDKQHVKHPQNSTSSTATDKKKGEKSWTSAGTTDKMQDKQSLGSFSSCTSDNKELEKNTICFGTTTNKDYEHSNSSDNTDKKKEKHFTSSGNTDKNKKEKHSADSGTTDKKEEDKLSTSSGTTDKKKEEKQFTCSGITNKNKDKHFTCSRTTAEKKEDKCSTGSGPIDNRKEKLITSSGSTDKKKEEKHSTSTEEAVKMQKEKLSTSSATDVMKKDKQSTNSGTTNKKKEEKHRTSSGTTDKKKKAKLSTRSAIIEKKEDKCSTSSGPTNHKKDKQLTSSRTTDKMKEEKYPTTSGIRDKKKGEKHSNSSGNTDRKKDNRDKENHTMNVKNETKLEDTKKYDKKSFEFMLNMHG